MPRPAFIRLDEQWTLGIDGEGNLMVSYCHKRIPKAPKKQKMVLVMARVAGGLDANPDRAAIFKSAERVVRHEMHERYGIEIAAGPDWGSLNLAGY